MTDLAPLQMTVAARVAEQLRHEIRNGELPAGSPLRQNDVAGRLGVSSTPVREAFQILERMGLVVREGRRGARVFHPSMHDLINGYEIRGALEALAAQLAAVALSQTQLKALKDTMRLMHARNVSQETFVRMNTQFHTQIARGSGNDRLADLIVSEQAATTSFVVFLGVDAASAREAHSEHAAIYAAIAEKDAAGAAAAMADHLVARLDALRARLGSQDHSQR